MYSSGFGNGYYKLFSMQLQGFYEISNALYYLSRVIPLVLIKYGIQSSWWYDETQTKGQQLQIVW